MTRKPAPRRLAALAALLVALPAVALTIAPTTSAWTDDARFRASASAGTWETEPTGPTGPTVGCVVVQGGVGGTERPGSTCSIVSVVGSNAQNHWENNQLVTRRADIAVTFSQTGWVQGDQVRLTLDMSQASGLPGDWTHHLSAPYSWSNLQHTSACSAMPVLEAWTTYWVNGTQSVSFAYIEDRTKVAPSSLLCSG